jgi:hypothetical protein
MPNVLFPTFRAKALGGCLMLKKKQNNHQKNPIALSGHLMLFPQKNLKQLLKNPIALCYSYISMCGDFTLKVIVVKATLFNKSQCKYT